MLFRRQLAAVFARPSVVLNVSHCFMPTKSFHAPFNAVLRPSNWLNIRSISSVGCLSRLRVFSDDSFLLSSVNYCVSLSIYCLMLRFPVYILFVGIFRMFTLFLKFSPTTYLLRPVANLNLSIVDSAMCNAPT